MLTNVIIGVQVAHHDLGGALLEVHTYVGAHATQRIALVATDGAEERLDTGVRVHVLLRCARCGAHHGTTRTLPLTTRTATHVVHRHCVL